MTNVRLSRRAFIRLLMLGGIGAGVTVIHGNSASMGTGNFLRWVLRGQIQKSLGRPAVVALGECPSYEDDVLACLRPIWNQADLPAVQGKRVLVKPNLVDVVGSHPSATAPQVVAAVLDLLAELGAAEVVVGDGPAFRREAWPVAVASGLGPVLKARGVDFVDLNYDDPQPVPVRDGWFRDTQQLWLPRHVREADLIVSIPKLKCHHWAQVSLSLKNLLGIVPGARYGWPKNILHFNGIVPSILGVYQTVRPVVSVVDGIVGMEGDGPLVGTSVAHGLLAVGQDPVAVDAVCTRLMGFSTEEVPHLQMAGLTGVGQTERVEVRGVAQERLQRRYQPPPPA